MAQLVSIVVLLTASAIFDAPAAQKAAQATHRVTVIGCVKRSEPDSAAATGTTILAPGQTRYVLVNVTLAGNADQTATAEQLAERVPMYRLADSADAMIAPHVGEKVQVSGTIVAAPTAEGFARPRASGPAINAAPVLKVEELQSISKTASSCQ